MRRRKAPPPPCLKSVRHILQVMKLVTLIPYLISVHDVINKILSRDSNCIIDVAIWLKFGNSCLEILHKCGKKLKLKVIKFVALISTFVGVTAEKLVEGLFGGGPNIFETLIKGKISSAKIFRWGKFSSPSQYFITLPRRKVFPQI